MGYLGLFLHLMILGMHHPSSVLLAQQLCQSEFLLLKGSFFLLSLRLSLSLSERLLLFFSFSLFFPQSLMLQLSPGNPVMDSTNL